MKSASHLKVIFPEIILLISTIVYWTLTTVLNPVAMVLVLLLIVQLYYNNNVAGFFIALLFIVLNLYMVLAMVSDLVDYETLSQRTNLLIFGTTYLGINLLASAMMIKKYIPNGKFDS